MADEPYLEPSGSSKELQSSETGSLSKDSEFETSFSNDTQQVDINVNKFSTNGGIKQASVKPLSLDKSFEENDLTPAPQYGYPPATAQNMAYINGHMTPGHMTPGHMTPGDSVQVPSWFYYQLLRQASLSNPSMHPVSPPFNQVPVNPLPSNMADMPPPTPAFDPSTFPRRQRRPGQQQQAYSDGQRNTVMSQGGPLYEEISVYNKAYTSGSTLPTSRQRLISSDTTSEFQSTALPERRQNPLYDVSENEIAQSTSESTSNQLTSKLVEENADRERQRRCCVCVGVIFAIILALSTLVVVVLLTSRIISIEKASPLPKTNQNKTISLPVVGSNVTVVDYTQVYSSLQSNITRLSSQLTDLKKQLTQIKEKSDANAARTAQPINLHGGCTYLKRSRSFDGQVNEITTIWVPQYGTVHSVNNTVVAASCGVKNNRYHQLEQRDYLQTGLKQYRCVCGEYFKTDESRLCNIYYWICPIYSS